ncbi:DUF7064 domain-containing protein [Aromatoleum toluclasticum]|uniref:DUF7064 domain-containing protein n=1 Tax=Aromatoleum toluclasticum TaxID=92003 RepID=UPI0003797A15|nr:hypothetical protein [Aromatoleum toluclasticum]
MKEAEPKLLNPIHDRRHRLRPGPHARESMPYMLTLPDERVAIFVYTWVTGEGKAGAAICAFGPGIGDEPIIEVVDGIAVPDEMDFDDWHVGGLHVRQREPLRSVDVSFAGKRASIEYHFEAMHPAYAYSAHANGCPPWVADDRFEQSGKVLGVLRIDDRKIPFDTTGHRDHSWGVRDWEATQHWKFLQAQAGPDLAVHFFQIQAYGRTELRGYVHKHGRTAEITGLVVNFEHDDGLRHRSVDASIRDAAGRLVKLKGDVIAFFPFQVSPLRTLNEAGIAVEIDGVPGAGWFQMSWPTAYLEHVRQQQR